MERNEAIIRIRRALKYRSGKTWSVTGGRGTAWGWIEIHAPPARRLEFGYMSPDDQTELAGLLGVDRVHEQGQSVSPDQRREFVARAEDTGEY